MWVYVEMDIEPRDHENFHHCQQDEQERIFYDGTYHSFGSPTDAESSSINCSLLKT